MNFPNLLCSLKGDIRSISMALIPCQHCKRMYPIRWTWFTCDKCGFRVCASCLNRHRSRYGSGYKCSQCPFGQMKRK